MYENVRVAAFRLLSAVPPSCTALHISEALVMAADEVRTRR